MKRLAPIALPLALVSTYATAQDVAPADWVSHATCAEVLHRIDNPLDKAGLSSPISGVAYLGAAIGYVEGYRAAQATDIQSPAFEEDVFKRCANQPDTPFKTVVEMVAADRT